MPRSRSKGEFGMESMIELSTLQVSAVKEMSNIGLGHAATALSEMTGRSFNMSVPSVESVPVLDLTGLLGGPEQLALSVFMPFEGDVEGYIAFLFPFAAAQSLWTMVLGRAPSSVDQISDLEASAMIEVGNIINSNFLNAWSDMTELKMHATPPGLSVEMAQAILSSIVLEAEMNNAVALAVETAIFDESHSTSGYFLCIPSTAGLETLFERLGISEAA